MNKVIGLNIKIYSGNIGIDMLNINVWGQHFDFRNINIDIYVDNIWYI